MTELFTERACSSILEHGSSDVIRKFRLPLVAVERVVAEAQLVDKWRDKPGVTSSQYCTPTKTFFLTPIAVASVRRVRSQTRGVSHPCAQQLHMPEIGEHWHRGTGTVPVRMCVRTCTVGAHGE